MISLTYVGKSGPELRTLCLANVRVGPLAVTQVLRRLRTHNDVTSLQNPRKTAELVGT